MDKVDSAYSAPPTQSLDSFSDGELVIEGTNVSTTATRICHCSGVKMSSAGKGGSDDFRAASIDEVGCSIESAGS